MTVPTADAVAAPSRSFAAALRLAAILLGAGTAHFVIPKQFDAIVPPPLPGNARTYTNVSGVAELAIGAGLLVPRTRRVSAGLAAVLFLAVFPANIQMTVDWWRSERIPFVLKLGALARLPLQLPLVTAALKVRRTA